MRIEAGLSRCLTCQVPWVVEDSFVSYKGIQGAFEELCYVCEGSAEELGIVWRHHQGCVGPSRGLEGRSLPLSIPTGVRLAPTSTKLVKGAFCERRLYGVLGSRYRPLPRVALGCLG